MVTFTIYVYVLPYRDMFINVIELFFQLCLLIFLMLRSTWSIIDDFLVFPSNNVLASYDTGSCTNETGISKLTWLLFPFAYLPLVVITIIFSTKITLVLW